MTMPDYVNEIEFASIKLLEIVWDERNILLDLERKIIPLTKAVTGSYGIANNLMLNAEDPEDIALATGIHWENYFGNDKKLYSIDNQRQELENRILTHNFSIFLASGALLQVAKQGISLVHQNLINCPNGRLIGSQPVKNVIWYGRNQALHWEEGSFNPSVQNCFNLLKTEIVAKYADYTNRSMSFDLVELLNWRNFDSFKKDLLLLS